MSTLPRRTALRRLSALALAVAAGKLRSSEAGALGPPLPLPHDGLDPFTLGVASGQPRPDRLVLWTRLAPRPLEPGGGLPPRPVRVRWQLAEDEAFARLVREGEALADPALAHSLRVTVDQLPADRRFFYRFIAGDALSPVGRTRTAPAPGSLVDRLRIALASCQHYEHGRFAVHREIAARDLDLVLFVGDYIYDSSNPAFLIRPHEGPQPLTLDDYRARHACYKLDPDLQAAHAAHPWILAWDDHEVRNDYAAAWAWEDLDAAAFVKLRAAAYQAYFEHLPLAADQQPGADGAMRMHDRYVWGQLAELWTLDGRQYRDLQACNDDGVAGGKLRWHCDEMADARRSLLGASQEAWLQRGLVDSRRQWKLIGQATQMSPAGLEGFGQRLQHSDGWDGYPAARARLLGTLAEHRLQDVAVLGGDVHRHVVAALRERPADPASPVLASEFVATSITSRGLSTGVTDMIRRSNPDILHARSDERGYAYIEIGNRSLHFDARSTSFPVVDRAKLHTQVKFVVESGQTLPQRDG